MLKTVWAVVQHGKIVPVENVHLAEGAKVLVTVLSEEDESEFWLRASQESLASVWDNEPDDVYAQLLQE